MECKVEIKSKTKKYEFYFKIHKCSRKEDRQIESKFYAQWDDSNQDHHDIEIVSLNGHDPNFKKGNKIHFHDSSLNEKRFVCWDGQLKTETQTMNIIRTWCAGTVYTLETGIDFQVLYTADSIGLENFDSINSILADTHGISIVDSEFIN